MKSLCFYIITNLSSALTLDPYSNETYHIENFLAAKITFAAAGDALIFLMTICVLGAIPLALLHGWIDKTNAVGSRRRAWLYYLIYSLGLYCIVIGEAVISGGVFPSWKVMLVPVACNLIVTAIFYFSPRGSRVSFVVGMFLLFTPFGWVFEWLFLSMRWIFRKSLALFTSRSKQTDRRHHSPVK